MWAFPGTKWHLITRDFGETLLCVNIRSQGSRQRFSSVLTKTSSEKYPVSRVNYEKEFMFTPDLPSARCRAGRSCCALQSSRKKLWHCDPVPCTAITVVSTSATLPSTTITTTVLVISFISHAPFPATTTKHEIALQLTPWGLVHEPTAVLYLRVYFPSIPTSSDVRYHRRVCLHPWQSPM